MATKILVSYPGGLSREAVVSNKQTIADALCVCPEDIVLLQGGLVVSVVDVPDGMTKAREKADKEAEAEAEKAAEEQQAAELEAIRKQTEEAAKANPPAAESTAPTDYESWTVADLHAEAAKREIEGRSGLDKAGLVKALHKADKKKA